MTNTDEYLVYTNPRGSKLYYKNKKLHREAGPAIIISEDIDKYINLSDENLYTPTNEPVDIKVVKPNENNDNKTKSTQIIKIAYLKKRIQSLPNKYSFEDPMEFTFLDIDSSYWLEGKNYSKEEFTSIMLKKEMETELSVGTTQSKKLKV